MSPLAIPGRTKNVIKHLLFTVTSFCFLFGTLKVQAQTNQTVGSSAATAPVTFPATGCYYKWTNNNPSIGLAGNGNGDIASFTAINTGGTPVVATITVTPQPQPPHTYGLSGGYVSVLDDKKVQIGTILVPNGLLKGTSPDGGILYFQSTADNKTLYVANSVTYQVIATIPISTGFTGVLVNPDGKHVYAGNFTGVANTQLINVINTATNTVENVITLNPGGIYGAPALSSDGSKLYLLNQSGNFVTVINTATNTFINASTTKPSRMLLSPDGNFAYVTSTANTIMSVINGNTGGVTTVDLKVTVGQIFINPDGKTIYYTSSASPNTIYLLDTQSLTVAATTIADATIGTISLSPDGKNIYSLGANSAGLQSIIVIDVATFKTVAVIPAGITFAESTGRYYSNVGMLVDYTGNYIYVNHTVHSHYDATDYNYLTVIDTKLNLVVDSIYNGTVPSQLKINPNSPCNGIPYTFTITVNPPPPAIYTTGTLAANNTTYGTPSATSTFSVSATNTISGVLVTSPAGFEVSTDNVTFTNTLTVGMGGTVPSTPVYVRLKAAANAGQYSGDIVLNSGPTNINVATVLSKVDPTALTVSGGPINKPYGTLLTPGPGAKTFVATGLKNTDTIGTVTATYGPGASATAALGNYPASVTVTAATGGTFIPGNYIITYTQGDINVTPATLTITAENKTRYFGEANPDLTVKYSGFVNNEDVSQLTTLPVVTTTATKSSIVGHYPITASGAAAANYSITYVAGVLAVEAQKLIVANAFTPNGDGVNDTWEIKSIGQYPNCTVEIFTRYGNKVFYSTGYNTAWNGKLNGGNLPVGTYYYIIKLDNILKPVTGNLTILR